MKKKHNNKVLFAGLIALLGFITMGTAFAGKAAFNFEIPKTQGWAYSSDNNGNGTVTDGDATSATIEVGSIYQIDSVTFYAGALGTNGSVTWNTTGQWIYASQVNLGNKTVIIPYLHTYGKGQKMRLKARNHTWALNKGWVNGIVNYH